MDRLYDCHLDLYIVVLKWIQLFYVKLKKDELYIKIIGLHTINMFVVDNFLKSHMFSDFEFKIYNFQMTSDIDKVLPKWSSHVDLQLVGDPNHWHTKAEDVDCVELTVP